MRRAILCGTTFLLAIGIFQAASWSRPQQAPAKVPGPETPVGRAAFGDFIPALYDLEDGYLRWPLAPSDQKYAAIDGKHLNQYVKGFIDIAYHYRDQGHQWWGRIQGTSADADNAQYMAEQFKNAGVSDVRNVPVDLPPQWMAKSFAIDATGDGKTLHITSAYPGLNSPATPASGLDLEVVYAGFGTNADYHRTDVHGKAVLIFSMPLPSQPHGTAQVEETLQRAQAKGAAAIIEVIMLPGNIKTQLMGSANVPTFTMGMVEGYTLRDMIGISPADQPVHLNIHLNAERVPNLKSSIVFATLPGATDEKIYILGHRDSWFQGAEDDASGMATMIGLAEYFAKMPQQSRRRTIIFMGAPGHHNSPGRPWGAQYLLDHKEMLEKTALVMNAEHTAAIGFHHQGEIIVTTNEPDASSWSVHGSARLEKIVIQALRDFGVPTYAEPFGSAPGEISTLFKVAPSFQLMNITAPYFHSDHDDSVPSNGLEQATRAYAKIIDEVNTVNLSELQAPPGNSPGANTARRE